MRVLVASAALCLLIGAPTLAHAQQEPQQQQDEKAKKQQEEKQKQAPEQKDERKQEEPAKQQNDRAKQEDKNRQDKQQQEMNKQEEKQQKDAEKQQKDMEKQQRRTTEEQPSRQEEPRQGESRTANQERAQRTEGGETHHGGRHIPDDRFHAEFGREHHFHAGIHRGERRFVYGGYSFEYVEAWPAEWRYDDDFYVDYSDDDYYLCDVEHPEVRLLVIVVD